MATGTLPQIVKRYYPVAAAALTADLSTPLGEAPFAGTITAVGYVAKSAVTGAATDTRTLSLANKGAANAGTAAPASLALLNTVNLAANTKKAITLSATPADLVVAAGDVLVWSSTHGGSTGLADPGGFVVVEYTRNQ